MNQRSKIILNIFISDLDNDTVHLDYLQISYNLTVYSIYTPMHAFIMYLSAYVTQTHREDNLEDTYFFMVL